MNTNLQAFEAALVDPLNRSIAKRTGLSLTTVIAVRAFLVLHVWRVHAEENTKWDKQDVADALDIGRIEVERVWRQLEERGRGA